MKRKKRNHKIISAFLLVLLCSSVVLYFAAEWYIDVYGDVGFDSILYTLMSDLSGVDSSLVSNYLKRGLLPALVLGGTVSFILFFYSKKKVVLRICDKKVFVYPFPRWFSVSASGFLSIIFLLNAANIVGLDQYIEYRSQSSTIYQEEYVDPDTVQITFPEEKRNLIYIFLESMEITYLSNDLGGGTNRNLIPELYNLMNQNINFSQNESVGGFIPVTGTGWTIGATVSQTAGIPLKVPPDVEDGNSYGTDDSSFLPGVTALSNILNYNGYYQAYMVGSDSNFGGRKQYFSQHGTDKIYDLYTAREDGIVPQDYSVWWGMEDKYLFEYAKQELTKIAEQAEPFSFTMLTVDTHHIGGMCANYAKTHIQNNMKML